MKKNIQGWLSGLFALQLGIAGLLYWGQQHSGEANVQASLLGVKQASIESIRIKGEDSGDAQEVELIFQDGSWQLANLDKLPADEVQVKHLLDKLTDLKTRWPVAKTTSAQKRFEVSEDQYQRKIELKTDQGTRVLYVGTSPGFRKTHVRLADQEPIYALGLNVYELSVDTNQWLKKDLLAVKEVTSIRSSGYSLVKEPEGDWAFEGSVKQEGSSPKQVDQTQAKALEGRLTALHVNKVAQEVPEALNWKSVKAKNLDAEFEWQLAAKDNQFWIRRPNQKPVFEIDQSTYEGLVNVQQAQLAMAEKLSPETDSNQVDMLGSESPSTLEVQSTADTR